MNEDNSKPESVVMEKEFPFPAERIWRALTEPQLIEEWLMRSEFKPIVGHRFEFSADWGKVECEVLAVEKNKTVSYTWGDHDLQTTVTWTLTPTATGTIVRMEQTGFRPDQPRYYHGAKAGWPRFFERLEGVLTRTG